ncbi:MAG: 2,3-bisphosphoglycerate-independent phosphoglycerate mutase [Chloroflexota bacterium]
MNPQRPVTLIILDGWGMRAMTHGNAVMQAHTPNYDRWQSSFERAVLDASGEAVGLPAGQMGNSEVGHLNLGAGRIIYQDITRIDLTIRQKELGQVPALQSALASLQQSDARLHLVGLLGSGGVHSHSRHLYALLDLAHQAGISPIIHGITDGRDTPPRSAEGFVAELSDYLTNQSSGTIATITGRYYAMDRDKRWDRTQKAYDAMVNGTGEQAASPLEAIANAYAQDVTDEFILPTVIGASEGESRLIQPGDQVLCFNFRSDRMRQMVRMLTNTGDGFELPKPLAPLSILTMTEYESDLPVSIIFEQQTIRKPLAEVISQHGGRQLHAAETEKYAHVTYFFNGGAEEPFAGEERFLAPSPKVATYDLKPEMSAYELAAGVVERIEQHDDDFILVNFANPDMVGHTGVLNAAIAAVSATDECAGKIVDAVLAKGGVALVTADHGNAERMMDEISGDPHTYHTTNPVAFLAMGKSYIQLRPRGILADVAPTVLELLDIPQPEEMSGESLIEAREG